MKYDLIVIGGGPAGVTAALRARELGVSVALVERDRLGGTCTNDGCVPTRVLARAARLIRDSEQYGAYGLHGERPVLNFFETLARTQEMVFGLHEKKQLLEHLGSAGVAVYAEVGAASFLDAHTVKLGEGVHIHGDRFILCAGGRARRLSFPGSEYALTHSDMWSLKAFPRSLAIVGGAATGCQLASIFAAFGARVWLLELGKGLLRREDPIISRTIHNCFSDRGIEVVTGIAGVERIERDESGLDLYIQVDGAVRAIQAEAVIMATGWPGNADLLNLEAAGVAHERGYVQVDDNLRTTAPHIFAAGDITGRMMLVQSAGYEARIAAENAALGGGGRFTHQIVPHGGFTDPEYGSVGLTEEQARAAEPDCLTAVVPYRRLDRAVIDGHTEGVCKLIVSQETHRILGAHIVGEQALEIIHLVAAGMTADMWVEQLAELEIAYPTYTAIVGLAARQIVHALGVVPVMPQWRELSMLRPAEWESAWDEN